MTSLCSPLKREISPLDTPKEKKALTSERESQRTVLPATPSLQYLCVTHTHNETKPS